MPDLQRLFIVLVFIVPIVALVVVGRVADRRLVVVIVIVIVARACPARQPAAR